MSKEILISTDRAELKVSATQSELNISIMPIETMLVFQAPKRTITLNRNTAIVLRDWLNKRFP